MKISVITVVYNGATTIEATLQSVAGQDHPDIEHIVLDGGSTDGTVEIVAPYRHRLAHFVSEPDRGIYDAMNKGLALASGDIVGFLNSDDTYAAANVLSRVAKTLSSADVHGCYSDLVYVERDDLDKVVRYWKSCPVDVSAFRHGWIPAHPTFFVRREIYQNYGYFDAKYRLAGDFELMLRFLAVHRISAVYCPEVWVKMRVGGVTNSRLSHILEQNREIYRAAKLHNVNLFLPSFIMRKIFARIWQYMARPRRA